MTTKLQELIQRFRATHRNELSQEENRSCRDLIEVIRRNQLNPDLIENGYIGINRRHQAMNWLTKRKYNTDCSEMKEFLLTNTNIHLYGNYVDKFYKEGADLCYYLESKDT